LAARIALGKFNSVHRNPRLAENFMSPTPHQIF